MITLPTGVKPANVSPRLVDFGYNVEAAGGADTLRIDRPGNRFEMDVTFAPMPADVARVVVARLNRAKSEGLRIDYPLIDCPQGSPGLPVVNGSDSGGITLKLRSCTVGYTFKEGYWLTLIGATGKRYLHNVAAVVAADGSGNAVLPVDPPLRIFPGDGNSVLVAKPEVEGLVTALPGWSIDPDGIVRNLGCTLREAS